jgi:hypothetical protein
MKSSREPKRDQVMTPVTAEAVHRNLQCYIRDQQDLGLLKRLQEVMLNSRNTFDDKAQRTPKAGVVLFGLVAALLLVCFLYFNF